jgi:hypothetical protein
MYSKDDAASFYSFKATLGKPLKDPIIKDEQMSQSSKPKQNEASFKASLSVRDKEMDKDTILSNNISIPIFKQDAKEPERRQSIISLNLKPKPHTTPQDFNLPV